MISEGLTPLALARRIMFSSAGASRSIVPFGIAGADCDLLHVAIGRMQQRAGFSHCDRGDRPGHVFGAERRAFQGINRNIDFRSVLSADLFADEKHRRFINLALADNDGSVDRQLVEFAAHGIDRGLIGSLVLAVPAQGAPRTPPPVR